MRYKLLRKRGVYIIMNFNLLSFLMIILIISITPVSAALISEGNENTRVSRLNVVQDEVNISEDDNGLNNIHSSVMGLRNCSYSLKNDSLSVKDRFRGYDWRVWKWPGITINIIKKLGSMMVTALNLASSVNKLKTNVDSFKTVQYDSIDDSSFDKDAKSMAQKLSKNMDTTFTAKKVNTSEIKKGDIVQYISQGKYPRYLEVVDIIKPSNGENGTGRQLLDHSYNVPVFVLKGMGDKEIKTFNNDYMELVPNKPVNVDRLLQNSVQIQQKDIKKTRNNAQNAEKTVDKIDTDYLACLMGGIVLGGSGVVCMGVGLLSAPIPPLSTPLFVLLGILTGTGFLCGMISLGLYTIKEDYVKKANKLKNNADLNENDLNNYIQTEKNNEPLSMNITTFDGIPIIKKPPIPNWKELQFTLIEKPLNGDLLPGPGLQFLYNPHDGYSGNDTFKFQYNDKYGKIKGNMTVNIQIKPIPVFTLENNERITKPDVNNPGKEYDNIYGFGTSLLTVFDEASNTELTNEQEKYLETHENRLLSKAEAILYNLQNFLNILYKEYYRETGNDENPTQRKLLKNKNDNDKFTKDANEMVNYLKKDKKIKSVKSLNCTYEELEDLVRNKVYDKDKVIVQVRDCTYIRYMKLIDINATNIQLKSGKNLSYSPKQFKNNSVSKLSDPRFNIIIVPENQDTDNILKIIWEKQRKDIIWETSFSNTGKIVCATLIGVGGVGVAVAGVYRLCDYCNSHTSQIITEQILNTGDPEEGTALLKPNQLTKTYTRITQEVSNDQRCNKKTTAISIVICGTLIAIGGVIGHVICSKYEQDYIDEKNNLNGYEPT